MPLIPEECGHFVVLPLVVVVEGMIMTLGASDVGSMEKEHGVGKPIGKIPVLPELPRNTITFEDIAGFSQHFENQFIKGQIVVQLFFQPSPEIEQLHVAVIGLVLHFAPEVELAHPVLPRLQEPVDQLSLPFLRIQVGERTFSGWAHSHIILELLHRRIAPDDLEVQTTQQHFLRCNRVRFYANSPQPLLYEPVNPLHLLQIQWRTKGIDPG